MLEVNSNCFVAKESHIIQFKFSGYSQAEIVRARFRMGDGVGLEWG